MNFGEKLKQLRAEKNWTQPQMAEAIGIEQSYLSKLENDKSVPSAEMFQAIVKALELDVQEFLKDIDRSVLSGPFKQIPEVANFISQAVTTKVHDTKKWLLGSSLVCMLGVALIAGAVLGVFFSREQHLYVSEGVILPNESDDIFDQFHRIIELKQAANILNFEQAAKAKWDFEIIRLRRTELQLDHDAGERFYQNSEGGRRYFQRTIVSKVNPIGNKILEWLGAIFIFAGIAGFFIEWRLRRLAAR